MLRGGYIVLMMRNAISAAGSSIGLLSAYALLSMLPHRASAETVMPSFSLTQAAMSTVADAPEKPAARPFGSAGTSWLTVGAGVAFGATEGESATDANASLAWNYFLINDVEFSLEGAGWYFSQPGEDQGGGSASLAFRWHFVNKQKWSLFAEIGVGVLAATGEVPSGGTSVDFLPRAGVGATFELSPGGARLQTGVRWHHISNARFQGDSNNPSRDGVMIFAGVMFPLN